MKAVTLATTLLFIDETDCSETDVFSLVGLVVPIDKADDIRLRFHRFMRELEGVPDRTISPPPELHGWDMLRRPRDAAWATDEHRVRAFAHIVEIVNALRLQVVRVAYYKASLPEALRDMPAKRALYSLCFGSLQQMVGPLLAESFVIPVMDGLNKNIVDPVAMSQPLHHAFRASPVYSEGAISIPSVENLMDPVFVDSRYSAIMQVADVTAYLLHVLDQARERQRSGKAPTDFKRTLASVAHTLDPTLVHGAEPIRMNPLP
jgi:hypothetical protein